MSEEQGYQHVHDHGNGNDLDHGHTRGHDHDHGPLAEETIQRPDGLALRLSYNHHDLSWVASFQGRWSCGLATAEDILSSLLESVGTAVEENGGIIGHIKGFIQRQGPGLKLSLTSLEGGVTRQSQEEESVGVEGVFIVFGVELSFLQSTIRTSFEIHT